MLDELEHRGEVERGVIDAPAAGEGADEQRRDAEAVAVAVDLRRLDVVEPAAPVVVGPHEGRRPPRAAGDERLDERAHELLTRGDAARRPLARRRRDDVGDRGECPVAQVVVVLVEADDVAEQALVVDEAVEGQQRHRRGLRAARSAPVAVGDAGVVVLDVDAPRDPGRLQPVEDRGQVAEAVRRDLVLVVGPAPARHPEHVVGERPGRSRGEEPVEEHVPARDRPREGQVPLVVVAHDRLMRPGAHLPVGRDEPVHATAVELAAEDVDRVVEVGHGTPAEMERPDAAGGRPAQRDRLARPLGDAVSARVGAEVVVEAVVGLHQQDEVLDRRRRARRARRGGGRGAHRRGGGEGGDQRAAPRTRSVRAKASAKQMPRHGRTS